MNSASAGSAPSPQRDRSRSLGFVLVLAAVLWSIWPVPAFWALLAAYIVAWLAAGAAQSARKRWPGFALSRSQVAVLCSVLLAPPLFALYRNFDELVKTEGLLGIRELVADRLRLEQSFAIAPPVVFGDRPQTLFVHASDTEKLSVRLSPDGSEVRAQNLGHGLFRADYDPRAHGPPANPSGSFKVELIADGDRIERTLTAVTPSAHPRWFASSPRAGAAITVSEETDEIVLIDGDRVNAEGVFDGPTDAAFFADGSRIAVSHRYDPRLAVLDGASGTVLSTVDLGIFQVRLAVSTDESLLAVAMDGEQPGISFVPLPEGGTSEFVSLPFSPDWIAFGIDPNQLIISSAHTRALHKIERESDGWELTARLDLSRPVVTMARAPDGSRVYVAVTDYRRDGQPNRGNHFIEDQLLTIATDELRVVGQRVTARRTSRQDLPGDIDRGVSPMGIVARENGSLLVAFAGSDEIAVVPADAGKSASYVSVRSKGARAPHGIADLQDGRQVISSPSRGVLVFLTGEGQREAWIAASDEELEREDPFALLQRRGEHAFYETTRAGVSCQSCHLHGGSDYASHNIGQGILAPTLSSLGVAGTAPYLRDASNPGLVHLLDVAVRLYRDYHRVVPDREQSIEAYLTGLALPLNPRTLGERDLARERAGLDVFVAASCTTCHSFPAFSNLAQHPARSIFPTWGEKFSAETVLDVASLRGVSRSEPYLHDGRALTLRDVIEKHNDENRHGDTRALSEAELEDLLYFLGSL